jgi:cytochrome b6-f complex iron-sulfur subunit
MLNRRDFAIMCATFVLGHGVACASQPYKIIELEKITATFSHLEFEFEREACVLQKVDVPRQAHPRVLVYGRLAFVALSRLCPHAGCQTQAPENGNHFCPCHGSEFDSLGLRLAGPSRHPLAALRLEVREGALYAMTWLVHAP